MTYNVLIILYCNIGNWAHGMRDGEGTLWVPIAKGNKDKLRKLYVGDYYYYYY